MKDGIKGYKFEQEISKNGSAKVYLATKISNGTFYFDNTEPSKTSMNFIINRYM